jgi:hypothetical protein
MQRHFSNRGEAHAEAVAAKMRARHKPTTKSMPGGQFRERTMSEAWQSRAVPVPSLKPAEKKETDTN